MSAPTPSSPLLEEIKGLWQFAKKPSVWIPSVTIPLFAIALWAYSSNPQWLEATYERSARTGKTLATDPDSPVTSADLDLDSETANNNTSDLAALLEQAAQASQTSDSGEEEGSTPNLVNQLLQPPSETKNPEANNPVASAIQDLLDRNMSSSVSVPGNNPTQFSPISGSTAANPQNNNDPLQQALTNLQAGNTDGNTNENPNQSLNPNQVNPNPSLPLSQSPTGVNLLTPTLTGTYAYPDQAGVTGSNTPTPGMSANVGPRGGGGYVVTPQGTYTPLHERGATGYTVTPQGSYIPLPQRGGTSTTVTPQGTYSYPRDRGTTGYTPPQQTAPNTNPNNLNDTPTNQPVTPNNPFNNSFNSNPNTTNSQQ
ncbi:MAG: hypothetical protein ACLFV6_10255 [Spirulinaceae cyanobacterium]